MFCRFLKRWFEERDAVAAVEAALIFPILLTLLLGTYDMGNAILSDQKVIRASMVTGDLVTRERSVSDADIEEAIQGGELALAPLNTSTYGVDIVSIRFDENAVAEIVWRETRNMSPNPDVLEAVATLAEANSGVVMVTVQYEFTPLFSDFVIGDIAMQETAFTRGRKTSVVTKS